MISLKLVRLLKKKHWLTLINYKNDVNTENCFKMTAVRHHEFAKISIFGHVAYICMWFVISIPKFALNGQ